MKEANYVVIKSERERELLRLILIPGAQTTTEAALASPRQQCY